MSKKAVSLSLLLAGLSFSAIATIQPPQSQNSATIPLEEQVPVEYQAAVSRVVEMRQFAIDRLGLYHDSKHYTWFTENTGHTLSIVLITEKTVLPTSRKKSEFLTMNGIYHEDIKGFFYLNSEQDSLTDEQDYYAKQGYDTYWRSVTDYHTPGNGKGSPITPSFLSQNLVNQDQTVKHEMCHEFVGINIGSLSSSVDESFCNFVGYAGAVEFFAQGEKPESAGAVESYHTQLEFAKKFNALFERVQYLYTQPVPDQEKMRRRKDLFTESEEFLGPGVNNASLWSWHPYLVYYPLMSDVYEAQGRNLQKFIEKMKDCPEQEQEALEYIHGLL